MVAVVVSGLTSMIEGDMSLFKKEEGGLPDMALG